MGKFLVVEELVVGLVFLSVLVVVETHFVVEIFQIVDLVQIVVVEHLAGMASSFTDRDYTEAGAQIAYDKATVFKAGIIVKTAPISTEEIDLLQGDQLVFAPVHLPSMNAQMLQRCLDKKIIAVALGNIKDAAGHYPIVRSMSQIAGIHVVELAAKYLSNQHGGRGILLGGIAGVPPANVVIIGDIEIGDNVTIGAGSVVVKSVPSNCVIAGNPARIIKML